MTLERLFFISVLSVDVDVVPAIELTTSLRDLGYLSHLFFKKIFSWNIAGF